MDADPFEGVQTLRFENRKDWLKGRGPFVGSSDMAGIVNQGYANQSEFSIWAEKTSKVKPEWTSDQEDLLAMGAAGEGYARRCFEINTRLVAHFDVDLTIRVNPDYPAFGASIDSWTFIDSGVGVFEPGDELAVVELKIINPREIWHYMEDELPVKYQIQIQHQMAAIDAKHGFLCVVCGTEVITKYVPRHQKLIDGLHKKALQFLECVRNDVPPPVDGTKATGDAIKRMYPEVEPEKVVQLPGEFDGLAQKRDALKEQEKSAREQAEAINAKVKMALKDAEYAVQQDGECFSWKRGARGRTLNRLKRVPAPVRKVLRDSEDDNLVTLQSGEAV